MSSKQKHGKKDNSKAGSVKNIAFRRSGQFYLSAILSVIASAMGLVPFVSIYLITVHLFENGIHNADIQYVLWVAAASLIGAVIKAITQGISLHISHIAAYDALYEIRIELASKLGSMPLGWFDRRNTGAIKRILHENVEKMEEALAHAIPELAAAVSIPILSIIALFFVDWRMSLIILITPVIGIMLSGLLVQMTADENRKYNELVDRMNSTIIQYINGMKVIKAFTQSQASFSDVKTLVNDISDYYIQMGEKAQNIWAAIAVAFRTGPLFVVPIGLLLFSQDLLSLPTLILFMVMSLGYARPIYNLMMHGSMAFYQIYTSMERIDKVFTQPSLEEPQTSLKPAGFDIEFDNVSFSYQSLDTAIENGNGDSNSRVIEDININIPHGSVIALVGPSGAGKTTISRLIPRFWDVDEGAIKIGGVDIRNIETNQLMNMVSFVFQDVFLFSDTIYENIRVGNPSASHEEIIQAAKMARCDEFAQELGGYDYHVGENGNRLSGGQRQRISIARAILKNSPIIVLDEATAFVDPENESIIQEALASLMSSDPDHPKTMVVVAHRLSTITEVDQIYVVDKGHIVSSGTHKELLKSSTLYQTLWQSHTDAKKWQFDKQANFEKLEINRNTTYDVAYAPLKDEFAALKTAKGFWQQIQGLVGEDKTQFRRSMVWGFVEGIFVAMPGAAIYLALLGLFDDTVTSGLILGLATFLLIVFIIQWILNKGSYMSFLKVDTIMQSRLRLYLSDYIRRLPLGFFTSRDVGYIDALFTTTIDFMATRIVVSLLISSIVGPALIFLFTLFIDWRMALIMAFSVPIAAYVLNLSMGVFNKAWIAQRAALKIANARMVEYIQGISVIRAFNLSGDRFSQFASAIDKYRHACRKTATSFTPAMIGFSSILEIGFALMLVFGPIFVNAGSLSFEKFLIFLLLGTTFYAPIMGLGDLLGFQRIIANGVNNINEFLNSEILPEPKASKQPQGYHIAFEDVHFSYDKEIVLDGVSFEIPERTMVALVGPSGSGKTTITNLIARFWDIDEGSVTVGGVDVRDMSSDMLLSNISMVFQDVYLFNDTIMNNIRFANMDATDEQVYAAARLAQAHEFISEMEDGYDSIVGEGGSTLSGGQKQRISIARAILKDAPIILLDEATASIDPENERLIQQAINALVNQKTVIIIAHRLSTVQTADQILVLKEGKLIQTGKHEELLKDAGLYRHFWNERQKARDWKLGEINSRS
jgi:ATP-binding cassette, subfamily B, bacterial